MPRSDEQLRADAREAHGIITERLRRFEIEMKDQPDTPLRMHMGVKYRQCTKGSLQLVLRDASESTDCVGHLVSLHVGTRPESAGRKMEVGLFYLHADDFPDLIDERVWSVASDAQSLPLLVAIDPDLASYCNFFHIDESCYPEHLRVLNERIASRLDVANRIAPNSPFYTGKVLDAILRYFAQKDQRCG